MIKNTVYKILTWIAGLSDRAMLEIEIILLLLLFLIMACGCGMSAVLPPVVESQPSVDWRPMVASQMGYACLESTGCEDVPQIVHAGETSGFVARMETPEY